MAQVGRRTFLKGLATAGMGASVGPWLTGCGSDSGKPKLSFWAFTDTRIAWQKLAFEIYQQEKKPDFEIEWLILPFRQMHDQLLITAQAGSGGPDIADVEISQFPRFLKGEPLFVDLRPKLDEMGEWDNLYHASATDPWSFQGKTYGIGNELNACLLSVRQDVWEKAGVRMDITTWDEFAEEGKRFHQDTGDYLIDQQYIDWAPNWWLQTLQAGSGFFDADGNPTVNADAGVRTLQWMQDAVRDDWSTLRPSGQGYNVALSQGNIASLLGPSWQFSGFVQQNIPDTDGKWHLMPMPTWTADSSPTGTWGGTGVCVIETSEYAEEAMDFVLFEHTLSEAVLKDFETRQVWPTYKPAFKDPKLTEPLEFFGGQRVGDLIEQVSPQINEWYTSPFWPETTDATVRLALTPAMQDTGTSAKDALTSAQRESEDLIDFGTG